VHPSGRAGRQGAGGETDPYDEKALMAAFQPADNLRSRTFIGLLIAQFLAAFNDQAIHASAMFFAINKGALEESTAIVLMPILFYAPWALFCTLAGYFADRYSKRTSLVFWKIAEIFITLIALAGFWLGTQGYWVGPWFVLSTVFLMGMHSAFFVPAKYAAMPEILQEHMLSRGNGLLESLSFLAVILGTVVGGILSHEFGGQEYWIGALLVMLAVVGAFASLLIGRLPPANPERRFPVNLYQPLWQNIRKLWQSRPLIFAVIGIAFFTFLVAYMRATVYLHGEVQLERWSETKTSIIVGMVALGIGLGSPLVGFLSGGKVELGLVPIGAVGMIVATVTAAVFLNALNALIACIIAIGFFTGFYLVPLFTLLQYRAFKTTRGDAIATSNFINVTGAITASLLMMLLVFGAKRLGIAPELQQEQEVTGTLKRIKLDPFGRPARIIIDKHRISASDQEIIDDEPNDIDTLGPKVKVGQEVIVDRYQLGGITHHRLRRADEPRRPVYDKHGLPRLFFLGAGLMTLVTLLILWRQLPDLFVRTWLWLRALPDYRLEVAGMLHLPGTGPVLLATNACGAQACREVHAATDRNTHFVLTEGDVPAAWEKAAGRATALLGRGEVVAVPVSDLDLGADLVLDAVAREGAVPVLPVWHTAAPSSLPGRRRRVYVLAGRLLPAGAGAEEVRQCLAELGEKFRECGREVFEAERALSAGIH
jgi:MFS family permease